MQIAIESTLAQGHKTGLGTYLCSLLTNLSLCDKENQYFLLHATKDWNGINYGKNFQPVSYYYFKQSFGIYFKLNSILKQINADIFHATCTTGCPYKPNIPVISTIHDIFPIIENKLSDKKLSFFFKNLIKLTAKYSDYFIYNSKTTQDEFCKYFGIQLDKGEVIYLGPSFEAERVEHRQKNSSIVCVGAIELRKNQLFLLDAYANALKIKPDLPDLVFIGPERKSGLGFSDAIVKKALASKVKWLNYISDEELLSYYKKASLMLYPSLMEGFGIPLVDAINCSLPVICSDIPVFREIGENYPVYAKPSDTADWITKLIAFYNDSSLIQNSNADLIQKYNWTKCAEKTLEIYKKVVNR